MSAAAHENMPLGPELSPRAIHDALLPEEAAHFDRQYRVAMQAATESLDLTDVLALLRHWQNIAQLSLDSESHRRMLRQAEILNSGGEVHTEPWSVTKARLGL